ncbi:TRAP transporter small permease [Aidingimonas lacisalsi]|uniref:TRAP transporter small permease n=1 Tax=Aidingimonas lacisalsi TaxID=2604086 RepID=UPI0011D18E66|nr:TRAP transporter small permease [Aidingimonas lacisalsi]
MKESLLHLNSWILKYEKLAAAALLGTVTLLLVVGVFFRYVIGSPFVWSESIAKLLIVWLTFIGTSISFAEQKHITVDSIIKKIPAGLQFLIRTAIFLLSLIILLYMINLGYHYTKGVINNTSPILGISMSFYSLSMPVMFAFSAFHLVTNIFIDKSFIAFETAE